MALPVTTRCSAGTGLPILPSILLLLLLLLGGWGLPSCTGRDDVDKHRLFRGCKALLPAAARSAPFYCYDPFNNRTDCVQADVNPIEMFVGRSLYSQQLGKLAALGFGCDRTAVVLSEQFFGSPANTSNAIFGAFGLQRTA